VSRAPAVLADVVEQCFEEEALPALGDFTRIPSLSPAFDPNWQEHGHIARAAELLRAWCVSRSVPGAVVEVIEIPGRTPVLFVEVPATDTGRVGSTTLVYGHLDKQPPLGTWREGLDPFVPVRHGDRLYGRGTADDGYAAFAAFAALEALVRTSSSHGRVVVLIEASEESGSPDLDAYLDALAERIGSPRLVVCLDSGCVTYDRLWITTSLRGNLVCTVRVDVLDEGVHSGVAGGIVPSSFRLLRSLISRIEDAETGELLLPELRVTTPEHRRREIMAVVGEYGESAAGTFPTVPGLRLSGSGPADRVELGTWRGSLALTGIEGIPEVRSGGNVLRPYTTAKLSIRLPPTAESDQAVRAIEAALITDPPQGARVRVEWEEPAQGWDAPETAPWLTAALEESSVAYFGAPARSMGIGGSIPFMSSLGARYPGTQFFATGVNGPESNAHGPNEFLHIPTAKAIAASVAHVLSSAP
jgi:acetylornithine deacetylase/succinyl-diaminopimelate desuccinylase-like protein